MIWLDYVLVFILIWNLYKGLKEGLLGQIAALLSFFVAFYAALYWSSAVRGFLETNLNLNEVFSIFSKGEGAVSSSWLPALLLNVIAFLILFFLLYFLFKFFCRKLSIFKKAPFIGGINAVLGAMLGGLKGVLIIFLILGLLSLIKTEFWMDTMDSSVVVALSDHYVPLLFGLIFNYVVKNLGTFV